MGIIRRRKGRTTPSDPPAQALIHAHPGDECWIPPLVAWAEERTDTLDFRGHPIPPRLQRLLQNGIDTGHIRETEHLP